MALSLGLNSVVFFREEQLAGAARRLIRTIQITDSIAEDIAKALAASEVDTEQRRKDAISQLDQRR
jgi:hypothetical protein